MEPSSAPVEAAHRPTLVHFNGRHSEPAEVCMGCSGNGRWVPVTQCPTARAQMTDGPGSLYADVMIFPEKDD